MNTLVIVVACGKEEEITPGTEAAFLTMGQTPMLAITLRTLQNTPSVDSVIVAVGKNRTDSTLHLVKRFGCTKVKGVVIGGVNRLSTLRTVFNKLKDTPSTVVIHEASRPFATSEVFEETVKAAKRYGCAIAAHKMPDAAKLAPKGMKATETLERHTVWAAQTPQAFKAEALKKILDGKAKSSQVIDDESELVKKPAEVHLVETGTLNIKVRSAEDLSIATALLNAKLISVK